MTNEERKNLIKQRIIYHADETKYRYELGKSIMDCLAEDIIKDLKLEEIITENNPLTLDEVKELKKGDVVWLKYMSETLPIKIDRIDGSVLIYNCFRDMMTYAQYICNLDKNYSLYRNKPEREEQKNV